MIMAIEAPCWLMMPDWCGRVTWSTNDTTLPGCTLAPGRQQGGSSARRRDHADAGFDHACAWGAERWRVLLLGHWGRAQHNRVRTRESTLQWVLPGVEVSYLEASAASRAAQWVANEGGDFVEEQGGSRFGTGLRTLWKTWLVCLYWLDSVLSYEGVSESTPVI